MNSDLKELQTIPGVGKKIAQDLWNIGIIVKNVTFITYPTPYIFLWLDQNQSKLNDI